MRAGTHSGQERPEAADVEGVAWHFYALLNSRIERFAARLLGERGDLDEGRVAVLIPAGPAYVTAV